jgi:hypothetical protein
MVCGILAVGVGFCDFVKEGEEENGDLGFT